MTSPFVPLRRTGRAHAGAADTESIAPRAAAMVQVDAPSAGAATPAGREGDGRAPRMPQHAGLEHSQPHGFEHPGAFVPEARRLASRELGDVERREAHPLPHDESHDERHPAAATPAVRAWVPSGDVVPRVWREELGLLAPFAADPAVTDLFVNGAQGLFVDRGHGAVREPSWQANEAEVLALATALIARGGRHVDQASPCVDVRLADGARVHAVLPPIARHGTTLSVRVPKLGSPSLAALASRGMFAHDDAVLAWITAQVHTRTNLLISGAAGAGKTTLLAALLAEAPASDRIVTIEDVAELRFDHPHHVSLEARQPNIEGAGEIGLPRLVREALRMRPDRLVVGECRGAEVRELLSALNTGHAGGAGTIHANGLADVATRLEALGALAGMSEHALARQVVSAIGSVLHVARGAQGHALIGVGVPAIHDGRLVVAEVQPWAC